MAIVTLPTTLKIEKLSFGRNTYDLQFSNADTGASSTRLLGPPRWTLSFSSAQDMDLSESSAWVSLILKLGGRVNHLEAWDVSRPVPRGTMRGTMTLQSPVAEGDTSATIVASGQGVKTLLSGDWLQIGTGLGTSQLVALVDDSTSDSGGVITVNFQSPARMGFSAGTAVTWDRPKAYFKANSGAASWASERTSQGGFSFDGLENWNA